MGKFSILLFLSFPMGELLMGIASLDKAAFIRYPAPLRKIEAFCTLCSRRSFPSDLPRTLRKWDSLHRKNISWNRMECMMEFDEVIHLYFVAERTFSRGINLSSFFFLSCLFHPRMCREGTNCYEILLSAINRRLLLYISGGTFIPAPFRALINVLIASRAHEGHDEGDLDRLAWARAWPLGEIGNEARNLFSQKKSFSSFHLWISVIPLKFLIPPFLITFLGIIFNIHYS